MCGILLERTSNSEIIGTVYFSKKLDFERSLEVSWRDGEMPWNEKVYDAAEIISQFAVLDGSFANKKAILLQLT